MRQVTITELPLETIHGKRIFVRIDADTDGLSPVVVNEIKLRSSLSTLQYLEHFGARVVIGTHIGQPLGKFDDALRLDPIAERLSQLLGTRIKKINQAIGPEALRAVNDLRNGDFVMLENLHFYPGELSNEVEFARGLAQLCDVYCNDAFALTDRGFASIVGITHHVRHAVAGRALSRELLMFESVLDEPERPFVGLIAGARIDEKLPLLERLLPRLDRLFIGGTIAFTFMRARGEAVGAATVDEAYLPSVRDLLRKAEKDVEIILPQDFIAVDSDQFQAFERQGRKGDLPAARRVLDTEILSSDLPVDIGPWTVSRIRELLEGAHTVFWNGPMGIWEIEPFGVGTLEVAKIALGLEDRPHWRSIICGDSLSQAIRSLDLPFERLRHLTSGGHSALQLVAGRALPGVEALNTEIEAATPPMPAPRRVLLPVDGSPHSLDAARRLGQLVSSGGAEISLIFVQSPELFTTDQTWTDPQKRRQRLVEQRFEAERVFGEINAELARQGLTSHRQFMPEGDPADEILKYAAEMGVDLIAMGSHGRTGIMRFLMGSVSRKVLDHAGCPVLITRIPSEEMVRAGMAQARSAGH
jgi:phosphoglycerate kinase